MLYILLIIFYSLVCVFLICTILLQAGRGGGLTDAFGGAASDVFGTQTPNILKKTTTVGAILFIVLSLILGMITARRERSLFDRVKLPALPVIPAPDSGVAPDEPTQEGQSPEAKS